MFRLINFLIPGPPIFRVFFSEVPQNRPYVHFWLFSIAHSSQFFTTILQVVEYMLQVIAYK